MLKHLCLNTSVTHTPATSSSSHSQANKQQGARWPRASLTCPLMTRTCVSLPLPPPPSTRKQAASKAAAAAAAGLELDSPEGFYSLLSQPLETATANEIDLDDDDETCQCLCVWGGLSSFLPLLNLALLGGAEVCTNTFVGEPGCDSRGVAGTAGAGSRTPPPDACRLLTRCRALPCVCACVCRSPS